MINRNNYEEYLLLYIDGEVPAHEKQAVEAFLEANPDLQEELELLRQTILVPGEPLIFGDKETLYRRESGISLANYQEYFLLYIDDELNIDEKEAVETFVLQNPGLQDEFTLLKQAVLPKEQVVFANKASLYRKEEKRRPAVISLRWASLAAAVMAGIIVMVWVLGGSNNNDGQNAGTTAGIPVQPKANPTKIVTPSVQPGVEQPEQQLPVAVSGTNNMERKELAPAPALNLPNSVQQEPIAVVPRQETPQQQTFASDPVASNTVASTTTSNTSAATNTFTGNADENRISPAAGQETAATTEAPPAAAGEELEQEEDNKNLYVGALQINPDKVRGFFRKAGRFLSSKVKNKDEEDGKVQVANFEINKLK